MTDRVREYLVCFDPARGGSAGYVMTFPAFPELRARRRTLHAAREAAVRKLMSHASELRAQDRPLPPERSSIDGSDGRPGVLVETVTVELRPDGVAVTMEGGAVYAVIVLDPGGSSCTVSVSKVGSSDDLRRRRDRP